MLSEAPSIFVMHLRKVVKYSISNGCLFSHYIIQYSVLRWYPKAGILYAIREMILAEIAHIVYHHGLTDAI